MTPVEVTPEMDRRNGVIFLLSYLLFFFAAPVLYIGIVQAALADKLGASATLANLPAATYQFGQFAPLIFAWLIPHRLERAAVVWAQVTTMSLVTAVFATLVLPLPNTVRLGALSAQGLLQGLSGSVAQVFMLQCLNRGTTIVGRARALKLTFTFGPVAAVFGSLGAQYVLNPGLPGLAYPYDFALLYSIGVPCVAGVAFLSSRYRIVHVEDEPRQPFFAHFSSTTRAYIGSRSLVALWFAYFLWNCSILVMSNLALYAREATGREPKDFSGLTLAIRFACKALGGYLLGAVALRFGMRASVLLCIGLVGAGCLWAWAVPGYAYMFAFGLVGAGELGGIYIPNFAMTLSPLEAGARNLALLTLATPASSVAPTIFGGLADHFGFRWSFLFGVMVAVGAFWSVSRIRATREKGGK